MNGPDSLPPKKLKAIESLFADLPKDYFQARQEMQLLRGAFQQAMASALTPRLNSFLQQQPSSLAEYQNNARSVNADLTGLGLNVDVEGKPAVLVADLPYSKIQNVVRYALIVSEGRTRTRHEVVPRDEPSLSLVPSTEEANEQLRRLSQSSKSNRGR